MTTYTTRQDTASDGYFVDEDGVGTVCFCFDDSGEEARKIAALLNAAASHPLADKLAAIGGEYDDELMRCASYPLRSTIKQAADAMLYFMDAFSGIAPPECPKEYIALLAAVEPLYAKGSSDGR